MADTVTCEHCGALVAKGAAERVVVEEWTHFFCSERWKLQWGEQDELHDDQ